MALQSIPTLKRHQRAADIGTGTGVLAIAAAALGQGRIWASDMDAPSVLIAKENVKRHAMSAQINLLMATGFKHRAFAKNKKFDLIISNIFARPLAGLAPTLAAHLKSGGYVVLAGFIHQDAAMVRGAYQKQRIYLHQRIICGVWTILILKKPLRSKF
jgi:ribosomal protein L11 methyltransferase